MRILFFPASIYLIILYSSCYGKQHNNTQPGSNAKQDIVFYSRYGSYNNYVHRYMDDLVITNYTNKTFSIKQLYAIAKHYRDTAKALLPIGSVGFIGQEAGYTLPSSDGEDPEAIRDRYIIEFSFVTNRHDTLVTGDSLKFVTFWVNGQSSTWYNMGDSKKTVDAMLAMETPVDNTRMLVYDRRTKTIK